MSGGEFAGRLAERVTLARRVPDRDQYGGWTGGWLTLGSAWALVEPEGDGVAEAGDAAVGARRWRVTLRPAALIVGDRIGWGAETLEVRRAWSDPALPDRMIAIAEEVE